MIISLCILKLLLYAVFTDIKTRKVSNAVQIAIILFCIPLIILNIANIAVTHIVLVLAAIAMMRQRFWGAADGKVIIPLILTMTKVGTALFFVTFVIVMGLLRLKYKEHAPLFVAILIGYIVELFYYAIQL